jgi:outer membrane receptor for ferrienterochelin and colicin
VADADRVSASSTAFKKAYDSVRLIPISKGGGLFVDKSDLYQVEGQYNLSDYTKDFADILIGGNYKRYVLNSEGTLFADSAGTIPINEYGAYIQATKNLFDNFLKLSFSGRYDKNENFNGRFTPRVTGVIKVAENNNIRLSYQTAYRFPTTQQQWIDLIVGGGVRLVGGNDYFDKRYGFSSKPTFYFDNGVVGAAYKRKNLNQSQLRAMNWDIRVYYQTGNC